MDRLRPNAGPVTRAAVAPHDRGADRWRVLMRPGAWFWTVAAAGLVARVLLATATPGTPDVSLWQHHAQQVADGGLIAHYASDPQFNHPPVMGWAMSALYRGSRRIGMPFGKVFRLFVALVDFGSVVLVIGVLRDSPWRFVAGAAYAVAPVALVLGAEHGNTDALVAAGLLIATRLAARRRRVATGAVAGIVACIKLPGLFAAPALAFVLPRWRDRVVCAGIVLALVVPPYAWAVVESARFARGRPELHLGRGFVLERVFLYRGYLMKIQGHPPVWIWGLKSLAAGVLGAEPYRWPRPARWWLHESHWGALLLITLFAFLRRRHASAPGIAATIAGGYAIFYALVETWATQYLAWAAPFWMLAGWPFAVAANVAAGAYIYGLYAFRSQDWLLRSRWLPQITSADWPSFLGILRDLSVLVFLAFAAHWFAAAVRDEVHARRQGPVAVTSGHRLRSHRVNGARPLAVTPTSPVVAHRPGHAWARRATRAVQ